MDASIIKALEIADKYNIEIQMVNASIEKHPDYGSDYKVFTIKVIRDHKSFTLKLGEADLGLEEGEEISYDVLYHRILNRLPKDNPGTFENYIEDMGTSESEEDFQISKRWYDFECDLFKKTIMLFPDMLEELREIEWINSYKCLNFIIFFYLKKIYIFNFYCIMASKECKFFLKQTNDIIYSDKIFNKPYSLEFIGIEYKNK